MTKKLKKIPQFNSIEEETHFWDTHSFADYEHEFTPVKVKFAKSLSQGITVRFDTKTLDELRSHAQDKGIGATTLIRMWILERLKKQEQVHA